jgi:predicted molibdopterin-dependent oxidoreductase YjgC
VEVRPEESILAAARRVDIAIPTLCDDFRLSPAASCRLCLVKIAGVGRPVASCAQKLTKGAKITTNDPDLTRWRRSILRLVLSENPQGMCLKCREEELCELHSLARRLGVDGGYEGFEISGANPDDPNPFILRDYTHCIYCYRCTRICGELEQASAISAAGRGYQTRISVAFDEGLLDSTCTFCGQCVQTCPTGALLDRKMIASDSKHQKVRTICPYCGTGCGINLHVTENQVLGVSPDWESPVNQGSLCVKGQFGLDFIRSPDRLTVPLIKGENGQLEEATWEEAYELVARRFKQIKAETGPGGFAFWSSSRSTTESNYLMQKFARAVIGTNNIDNCART